MGRGRAPCCDKSKVKRGPWSPAEDMRLMSFIQKNGHENWRSLPKQAGIIISLLLSLSLSLPFSLSLCVPPFLSISFLFSLSINHSNLSLFLSPSQNLSPIFSQYPSFSFHTCIVFPSFDFIFVSSFSLPIKVCLPFKFVSHFLSISSIVFPSFVFVCCLLFF